MLASGINLLKRFKIKTKILSGFALVLLLSIVLAAITISSLNGSHEHFSEYRALARQTAESAHVEAHLQDARLHVKDFLIDDVRTSYVVVAGTLTEMAETIDAA